MYERTDSDLLVAFLLSFVAVTTVLCGILILSRIHDARWQTLTESLASFAHTAKRPPGGEQTESPVAVPVLKEGVVFAVGYPDDGSLVDNTGICPDTSQAAWLEEFKEAVNACAKLADRPPLLNVRGFASIAPVVSTRGGSSDEDNLEIANRRGRVIARFLADERENLDDCNPEVENICASGRETADGDCTSKDGTYFVRYRDWPNYRGMRRSSPVNDGGRPSPRYRVEFLNRTVHIVVMNNACWQPVRWHWVSE